MSPQTATQTATSTTSASTVLSTTLSAALAILLGSVFVYGVGFASPMTIHNAAHDSRHSFAFPCH